VCSICITGLIGGGEFLAEVGWKWGANVGIEVVIDAEDMVEIGRIAVLLKVRFTSQQNFRINIMHAYPY
jgi:hypothetical protein